MDECGIMRVCGRYTHKIFEKEKEKRKENRKPFYFF